MQVRRVSWAIHGRTALVVAQTAELLEDLGEHVLEDVLGVLRPEPEALAADRVDVPRESLDELVPRLVVPVAAARDEILVAESGYRLHLGDLMSGSTD